MAQPGKVRSGPAQKRYVAEQRWTKNKQRGIERDQRERLKHVLKHEKRGTLGYRARQIERSQSHALGNIAGAADEK